MASQLPWKEILWTEYDSPETREIALQLARGSYQTRIVLGTENLSGSSLRGYVAAVPKLRAKYVDSRESLLARLQAAGIKVEKLPADPSKGQPSGESILRLARGSNWGQQPVS